jgi:hypothetical protein
MGGKIVRTIGIARARFKIGMMNLGYNIRRLVQLERLAAAPATSCNGARGRPPGIKTAPDRGLTWARALHSFAQLRQNRQNQLLFEVPLCNLRVNTYNS